MLDDTKPVNVDAEAETTITLKNVMWQTVIGGLHELPIKVGLPTLNELLKQLTVANKPSE